MEGRRYKVPHGFDGITPAMLRRMKRADQLDFMRTWFGEQYDPPEANTPWDSEEKSYVWIWGGPYEPREVLEDEFGSVVAADLIEELASELEEISYEWTKKPVYDDYDLHLYDVVRSNTSPIQTFTTATTTIESLLQLQLAPELAGPQQRLLYANVIAALETYLADRFMNAVLEDEFRLRRFLESNPDFQKQTVRFSDILSEAGKVREKVKGYLLDVVWHNMAKVQAMYAGTFEVKFGAALAPIAKAIETRHDIVHRNGTTKDGSQVQITAEAVRELVDAARALVSTVDAGMSQAELLPF